MTSFLAQIEHHLERVEQISSSEVVDLEVRPDFARHEAVLMAKLADAPARAQRALERWPTAALDHFVDELWWALLGGFGAKLTRAQRADLIDYTIDEVTQNSFESGSTPAQQRAMQFAWQIVPVVTAWKSRSPWQVVSRYCERIGLCTSRPSTTLAGRIFAGLRGHDRLRWIVACENVRGGGGTQWCVDATELGLLLRHADRTFDEDDVERPRPRLNWSGIERWAALGLLEQWSHEPGYFGYHLTEVGQQVLGPSQAEALAMFRTQALAQLHDERNDVLQVEHGPSIESSLAASRQARLVAHELRNALLPIQDGLRRVWRELERTGTMHPLAEVRTEIEASVSRLYRFADVAVKTTAPRPPERGAFALVEAIEEARRSLGLDFGGHIRMETSPAAANPRCSGHRGRFVLALRNLFNNAVESGGAGVRVDITLEANDATKVHLMFDDDGPGVAEADRDRVFEAGFSTKPSGSGHGLALVREVVERDLQGQISYEDRPEGGARFHLILPTILESP